MGKQVCLLGVELAPMARVYELDGVSYGRWPVEALSEGIPHEGPRSNMVATSPREAEKPSFQLAELPPPGAMSAPRLRCVELGSSTVLACFLAALLPPQRSGLLEGNG